MDSKPDVSITQPEPLVEINLRLSMTAAVLPNGPKAANGAKVNDPRCEVFRTWGELCERSGMLPGDTPQQSPLWQLTVTHPKQSGATCLPSRG
jgi:hypothetical protein